MKVCVQCQKEYTDDMAFCPHCGTPLQLKVQEYSCPTCGKILGKIIPQFCPYCGQKLIPSTINDEAATTFNNTTDSGQGDSENPGESSVWSFLKSALGLIGLLFLAAFSKACGRGLARGTMTHQIGFLIGVIFAGAVGGAIPAFVAYKYCKFDNPSTAVSVIFIVQIIVSFLSAYGIIPIGSIPIGIILAILLYCFNKK